MSITINIHGHCADHEAVLELLERVNDACIAFSYQVDHHIDVDEPDTREPVEQFAGIADTLHTLSVQVRDIAQDTPTRSNWEAVEHLEGAEARVRTVARTAASWAEPEVHEWSELREHDHAPRPEHTADSECIDPFCPVEHDPHAHLLVDDDDMDLTPPQGITRPHSPTELPGHIYAREQYISALVSWTRQEITEGPISELNNQQLRDAYRDFLRWGIDTNLRPYGIDGEQAACLRGAFRDATAGQVPL